MQALKGNWVVQSMETDSILWGRKSKSPRIEKSHDINFKDGQGFFQYKRNTYCQNARTQEYNTDKLCHGRGRGTGTD
jgi:hypothetical protein